MTEKINPTEQNELDDPEVAYRRGMQHGAARVFDMLEARIDLSAVWHWVYHYLPQWRIEGLREYYERGHVERSPAPACPTRDDG
jgi:hypothetical protein